jgi:hypothetical protein
MRRQLGMALGIAGVMAGGVAAPAVAAETPDPTRTYVVDCTGELDYKPKRIVFACGDGGVYFGKIKWSKWNMNEAVGRGTLYYNICEPSCGAGNVFTYKKVRIELGGVASGPGMGTMVNTFSSLTGTFGPDSGPAMSESATWALDNPIKGS